MLLSKLEFSVVPHAYLALPSTRDVKSMFNLYFSERTSVDCSVATTETLRDAQMCRRNDPGPCVALQISSSVSGI